MNKSNLNLIKLKEQLFPVKSSLLNLNVGDNLLVEYGNNVSLLKFEKVEFGNTDPLHVRYNRHTSFHCIGNLLMPRENDPYTHKDKSKRIVAKARAEILGTHRIDFSLDNEFNLHLPSAERNTDLYLDVANMYGDKRIENVFKDINLITDENLVVKRLKEITRENYFEQNIIPFLESRPTDLYMPYWETTNHLKGILNLFNKNPQRNYLKFDMTKAHNSFSDATKDLESGSFVYVGSKHEVYLLGLARDGNEPYMQGTYTTSTKPMLFFSNNYLGNMNAHEGKKPLFKELGNTDYNKYRTISPPEFGEISFVFSAMGREQNCKNHIFNAEPELITGNLEKALEHFNSTDFNEFSDVVKSYSDKIRTPTPDAVPNGKFFY